MRDPGSVRSRLTDPTNDSIKISNFLAKNNRRSPRHACVPTNRSRREPHESNNVERACTNKTSETKGHFSHLLFPSLFLPINYPPDFVLHRGEISTSDIRFIAFLHRCSATPSASASSLITVRTIEPDEPRDNSNRSIVPHR